MLASVVAVLAACAPQGSSQEPIDHWLDQLAALARDDGRHDTFGPTGARLWGTRLLPEPGFIGSFHYLQYTTGLDDPLVVDLVDDDGEPLVLEVARREWQPSHDTVEWRVAGRPAATVISERWITADDVLVARFRLRGLPPLRVQVDAPLAGEPVGDPARFSIQPLAALANEDLRRSARLRIGAPDAPVFWEAERYARQVGASGDDRKAAASGGAVLGAGFGGEAGNEVAYRVMGTGKGAWTLLARYARVADVPARFEVAIDGGERGVLTCAPTAGWGTREQDFVWARLDLGSLDEGVRELTLTALERGANTDFDGFFLVPTPTAADPLPERARWAELDALRGALELAGGRRVLAGVPFELLPPMGPQGVVSNDAPIVVGGDGGRLHVLAVPTGPEASLAAGDDVVRPGPRRRALWQSVATLSVPAEGEVALRARDCVVLAVTRERGGPAALRRRGHARFHGVDTELRLTATGLDAAGRVPASNAGAEVTFHVALEFSGPRVPGVATARALAAGDTLLAHRREYAGWFAENAPRLHAADPLLQRLWTYRWFLVRHNLAWPSIGHLRATPVVYEGRHGSWYPRVITFSTPHIVAETRWLADPRIFQGNVRALLAAQQDDGVLPNLLVGWQGARYTHWIPEAVVEAFKVHPDPVAMGDLLPGLVRNVEGVLAQFDPDGDGLLSPGDHYATGMEFQPSFWALSGYDDTEEQTDLERPDFNAYVYGSARALAEAERTLGREAIAARMEAAAEKVRAATMAVLWNADDAFFYSVRASDHAPARCKEVVGFYPFRFGLAPDRPDVQRALAALVDPEQFWTPFPVASCSKQVPVYSPHVRSWPGPGGKVTACMWNGPVWPHAESLVADAMARVLRYGRQDIVTPAHLTELLQRYARFHCEGGDPQALLLREYGDAETGANVGCPDYMHSTFNDLIIRHVLGLLPRFDDALEVRPLGLAMGDIAVDDLPYHGHRISIAITGQHLRVTVDGTPVGEAPVSEGLLVPHLVNF